MKLLLVALVLTGSAAASTQDPFDQYMASVKNHQPEVRLQEFAKSCGASLDAEPIYAVNVGDAWKKTTNLAKGVRAAETDFLSTAAIWSENGRAKMIDFWSLSLDVGSEINVLYCLDASGKVRVVDVVNNSLPQEGSTGGSTYKQHVSFDAKGKTVEKTGHFEDASGRRIKKPKLDDVEGSFDWMPDAALIPALQKALLSKRKDSK